MTNDRAEGRCKANGRSRGTTRDVRGSRGTKRRKQNRRYRAVFDQRNIEDSGGRDSGGIIIKFPVEPQSILVCHAPSRCLAFLVKHSLNSRRKLKANTPRRFFPLITSSISFLFVSTRLRFTPVIVVVLPFRLLFRRRNGRLFDRARLCRLF